MKKRNTFTSVLLLACLFLSACNTGQIIENTSAPIPTRTATSLSLTSTPTFTPIPSQTPIPPTPTIDKGIQNPQSGHWYRVSTFMGWEEAKEYCSGLGGHLLVIDDSAEDTFVYKFIYSPLKELYILLGATDMDDEGHWVWSTGEDLQYTNWAVGEPNNCGYTDCRPENFLTYHDDHPGQWNDVSSDVPGSYICEFEN